MLAASPPQARMPEVAERNGSCGVTGRRLPIWQARTWCPTGTALRVRKAGTVTVEDPKAGEKNA